MKELKNLNDLSKNLGVCGNGIHHDLLENAVKETSFSKSKLVQMLLIEHLDTVVKSIKEKLARETKNERYLQNCNKQRERRT
jgi:hypothetical protein